MKFILKEVSVGGARIDTYCLPGGSTTSSSNESLHRLPFTTERRTPCHKSRRPAAAVASVAEELPTALWQRCYVHFLRNCLDHLPRSADRACLLELRWLYDRRDATEARTDLHAWLAR